MFITFTILLTISSILGQYVTTIAGNGTQGSVNGQDIDAQFNNPTSVASDAFGNLYVGENGKIRKINGTGYVSTFAAIPYPYSLAIDSLSNILVASINGHKIYMLNATGSVVTVAGNGSATFSDGPGVDAGFNTPRGVAVDPFGNIYVSDGYNYNIRKINASWYVSTIAGSGIFGYADGQGAAASFKNIYAVTTDSVGNVYVCDPGSVRIRKINITGYVSTLAGSGSSSYSDGQGMSASFNFPTGIAADAVGNVYVSDRNNNRIRMISPSGFVTTVAGNGTAAYSDGSAMGACFNQSLGICLDSFGGLYVVDQQRIRKIVGGLSTSSIISSTFTSSISSSISSTFTSSISSSISSTFTSSISSSISSTFTSSISSSISSTFTSSISTSISSTFTSSISSSISSSTKSSYNSHTLTNISAQNQSQTTQSFYMKPEFIYSALVGFLAVLLTIYISKRPKRVAMNYPKRIVYLQTNMYRMDKN